MTTDNQPISAACAAALLLNLVPEMVRAETYPQWSDGTGETVRTTRMIAYDDDNRVIELMPVQRSMALDTLLRVEGGDWDRPLTFDVAAATLSLTFPVVASLPVPLWDSPLAVAAGFVASEAANLTRPVDWYDADDDSDDDVPSAGCVPEFVQRPTVDVPVVGGAL